jgi:hypothetical protein
MSRSCLVGRSTAPSAAPCAPTPAPSPSHLHVAELGDGEVKVLDGGVVLVGLVVEEQLRQVQADECHFRTEADV